MSTYTLRLKGDFETKPQTDFTPVNRRFVVIAFPEQTHCAANTHIQLCGGTSDQRQWTVGCDARV